MHELPTACAGYRHTIEVENAPRMADWITNRGGLAVWVSVNLSNPGKSWTGPVRDKDGKVNTKPSWESANDPVIITDPAEVGMVEMTEFKRFHVGLQRGSGFSVECTPGASRKIRKAIEDAGEGATHHFHYDTREAVIMKPNGRWKSLKEWMDEASDTTK